MYADILFLVNFSMDYLSLFITGKMLHRRMNLPRMCVSACVGATYGVISAAAGAAGFFGAIIGTAVSFLICAISFREGSLLSYAKVCGVFWCVSALLGGIMTALYGLLNSNGGAAYEVTAQVPSSGAIGLKWIAGLATVAGIAVVTVAKIFAASAVTSGKSAEMTIVFGGESVTVTALVDSGNLLYEPISGRPCAVVSADAIGSLFDEGTLAAIRRGDIMKLSEAEESSKIRHRLRLIPRKTLDGSRDGKAPLIGFIPDSLIIRRGDKILARDAAVAVADVGAKYFGGLGATVPTSLLS